MKGEEARRQEESKKKSDESTACWFPPFFFFLPVPWWPRTWRGCWQDSETRGWCTWPGGWDRLRCGCHSARAARKGKKKEKKEGINTTHGIHHHQRQDKFWQYQHTIQHTPRDIDREMAPSFRMKPCEVLAAWGSWPACWCRCRSSSAFSAT